MEKISELQINSKVVRIDAGWHDMGSWDSVLNALPKDDSGNHISDGTFNLNSENNLIFSEKKPIVTLGLKDTLVIDTPDALLVSAKNQSGSLKDILQSISLYNNNLLNDPAVVIRPWGSFETLSESSLFKIKRLIVKPGQKLSKQKHKFRSEVWTLVSGEGLVTLGEEEFFLKKGQSINIPVGSIHRLENKGSLDLELIEVQTGSYFGEDDITRYDDIYGRN